MHVGFAYAARMEDVEAAHPDWDWSTPLEAVWKQFLSTRGYQTSNWWKRYSMWHFDAVSPEGDRLLVRVRNCGKWSGTSCEISAGFGIGQKASGEDTSTMLRRYVANHESRGVTHELAIQSYGPAVLLAGLYPLRELPSIWRRQRDVLAHEWQQGRTGRKRSTVENGSVPSIWLRDVTSPGAQAMAQAFWDWPSVTSIRPNWPPELATSAASRTPTGDTIDDLDGAPYPHEVGDDGQSRFFGLRSSVKRNAEVRRRVAERATDGCEACSDGRSYRGFLDVHHVFGVDHSDREWTCVALCPNCHRAAHWAPDAGAINARLVQIARSKFEASHGTSAPDIPPELVAQLAKWAAEDVER